MQIKHLKVIAKITMEISTMNMLILLHVVNASGEEIFNGGWAILGTFDYPCHKGPLEWTSGGLLKPTTIKPYLGTILTQFFAWEGWGTNITVFKIGFETKKHIIVNFYINQQQKVFYLKN